MRLCTGRSGTTLVSPHTVGTGHPVRRTCGLDTISSIAHPASPPFGLSLKSGSARLKEFDPIEPILRMPDFPAYLQVDYLAHDGSVSHLFPVPGTPDRAFAANATLNLRDRLRATWTAEQEKVNWRAGPPFGTDMIVAFASSLPLFPRRGELRAKRS